MILTLWLILVVLSLILVTIGLFRPEHTELSLIGFVFLFLLALNLEVGTIEISSGSNYTYSCLCCDSSPTSLRYGSNVELCTTENSTTLVKTGEIETYTTWNGEGTLSHIIAYWLMVGSVIGFLGVILSIRRDKF